MERLENTHPFEEDRDESYEGVTLLSFEADLKVTAEDCGAYWYIRNWEKYDDGINSWFSGSGYSIDKEMVAKLSLMTL